MLIPQLEVCQEGGGQEGGYLEDVQGFWLTTWMTGSFLTSRMMFIYPKENTLKILCWYLNKKCVRKGGLRRGVQTHSGHGHSCCHKWCFFTPRKIPQKFVLISQLEVCQEGVGGQEGGYLEEVEGSWPETWRHDPSWRHKWCFFYPKEDILKILCWYLN